MDGSTSGERHASPLTHARPDGTALHERTSQRWWGLDWASWFPLTHEDLVHDVTTIDEVLPFIDREFPTLFSRRADDHRFLSEPLSPAKMRFCRDADVFSIKDRGRLVGLLIGHPTDATSYYLRVGAIVSELQGRRALPTLVRRVADALATVGVERVESDILATNQPSLITHIRTGFAVVGTHFSERHGALTRVSLLLSDAARRHFHTQFCPGDP